MLLFRQKKVHKRSKRSYYSDINNIFRKSGCLLTSLANLFDFYGDKDENTPEKIDAYVDKNKLWINGTAMIDPEKVVTLLGYKFNEIYDNKEFNNLIRENLNNNIPTIVHYAIGHFATVAGARYDAKGTITDYLMRDPGSALSTGTYLPVKTLYNHRWKSSIDKIYWISKNK